MKKFVALNLLPFLMLSLFLIMSCKKAEKTVEPPKSVEKVATQKNIGEELFNRHCILCHREVSMIMNINELADIVKVMRNPKGSMPEFNEEKIPDQKADEIAKFIFLSITSYK
jgi:mono/diheme cytochrome c family protein